MVPTVERGFLRGRLLVDRDRRREALDEVDVGLVHLAEELAGVRRQRLDVAALALGEDRVERQARLARPGQPGEDDQRVAREVERDVLEVVLAGAPDDELVGHVAVPSSAAGLVGCGRSGVGLWSGVARSGLARSGLAWRVPVIERAGQRPGGATYRTVPARVLSGLGHASPAHRQAPRQALAAASFRHTRSPRVFLAWPCAATRGRYPPAGWTCPRRTPKEWSGNRRAVASVRITATRVEDPVRARLGLLVPVQNGFR